MHTDRTMLAMHLARLDAALFRLDSGNVSLSVIRDTIAAARGALGAVAQDLDQLRARMELDRHAG